MSLQDKINELIEEEINLRLVDLMNEYVNLISKKHGIAIDLLLKDIPKTVSGKICKGVRNDGRRCTRKGIHDGYCGMHVAQNISIKCLPVNRTGGHTHGPDKMFVEGCQECLFSKELIDLNSLFNNEQN